MEIEVDTSDLLRLAYALEQEQDGNELRRDLMKELREAAKPAVVEAKASLWAMSTGGLEHEGESLRAVVAGQVRASSSLSANGAGVKVRVGARGPRGFRHAARKLNRGAWRHPVFGRLTNWVTQLGKKDWFDGPLREHHGDYRRGVLEAMRDMRDRIASRI
jgi:hypothetical protein